MIWKAGMSPFVKTIELSLFQQALYKLFPGLKNLLIKWFGIDACDSIFAGQILFPRNNSFMDRKFLLNLSAGNVEKEEIKLCMKHLKTNSRIVEIGSGLGIAASIINRAKNPEFHICFEVNPLAREYCEELFQFNNLEIATVGKALGSGQTTKFYQCKDYVKSSFTPPAADVPHVAVIVETTSISNIIHEYKPNVLICDIEGAEADFITPAELTGIQSVMMELHPKIYGIEMQNEIMKRFISAGFKVVEKIEDCVFFQRKKI
ncbi:MAG: FkbM family methyltransferase [Candidatus Puniceispirillaceae bacterium]